jgi:hypothetical protein
MHGAKVTQVINADILPIGQLSEEAGKSLHKQMKAYWDRYLKFSRITNNTSSGMLMNVDFIDCLLVSSEPLATNLRPSPCKQTLWISKHMLQLIPLICILG